MTDEVREALISRYDSCNRRTMAERFGVPPYVITKWARELGVARTKEPRWGERELAFLERYAYRRGWTWIAKRLGRSRDACILQAKRLKLRTRVDGFYSANQVAVAMGVDIGRVRFWVSAGWLEASRRGTDRTMVQGGDTYCIEPKALRWFLCAHPEELDLRRVDKVWLLDVLVGAEAFDPAKRRADRECA